MNTQSLTRKQELKIDSIVDYIDWAWVQIHSGINDDVLFKLTHFDAHMHRNMDHDDNLLADVKKVYLECIDFLGIDLPSISYDHSSEAEAIRKIYFETRQYKDDLYVIDIRPISYFKPSSNVLSILDDMAISCGFLPQHENWIKHGEDLGKMNLISMFEFDHKFHNNRVVMSNTDAKLLADSFLSHFQNPRYYSNSMADDGCVMHPQQKPKRLEPIYEADFGVILHDEKNIGMIATVTNIM